MKKYSKEDQRLLATWATECAARVLPYFEQAYPNDDRPRKAIEACRVWIRTGVFTLSGIRAVSLASHAAARGAAENVPASLAARVAGQAVAIAHVPQHAYGGAYYALKAVAAADPAHADVNVAKERDWQSQQLPERLREVIMRRIIVRKDDRGISIYIQKGEGF